MMQNTLLFAKSLNLRDILLCLTEDTVAVGADSGFLESTRMLFFFCPNLGLGIKTLILHIYEETMIFQ